MAQASGGTAAPEQNGSSARAPVYASRKTVSRITINAPSLPLPSVPLPPLDLLELSDSDDQSVLIVEPETLDRAGSPTSTQGRLVPPLLPTVDMLHYLPYRNPLGYMQPINLEWSSSDPAVVEKRREKIQKRLRGQGRVRVAPEYEQEIARRLIGQRELSQNRSGERYRLELLSPEMDPFAPHLTYRCVEFFPYADIAGLKFMKGIFAVCGGGQVRSRDLIWQG